VRSTQCPANFAPPSPNWGRSISPTARGGGHAADRAAARGALARRQFVVFPELALTTFFPRLVMTDQGEITGYFERDMPNEATRPCSIC